MLLFGDDILFAARDIVQHDARGQAEIKLATNLTLDCRI